MDLNNPSPESIIDYLKIACSEIGEDYFRLERSTWTSSEQVVRERVYCYELYHQLRRILDKNNVQSYKLHGEVDKSGQHMPKGLEKSKPDLIVHKPGRQEESNLVVVEVKPINKRYLIRHDLDKLNLFLTDDKKSGFVGYKKGVMLVYGNGTNETDRKSFRSYIAKLKKDTLKTNKDKIQILWHHKNVGDKELEKL